MSDFSPGVERAQKAGYKISVGAYPAGASGVQMSLDVIGKKIRDGRLDPDIRGWAGDTLIAAGRPRTARDRMAALTAAFRKATVYVADPVGAEYIASGSATMCLRPGLCVRARDCFPAGTKLLRDDFALVPIEEIKVGDKIWGRDKWTEVKAAWAKGELAVDAIDLNNGSTVYLTADHKVYVGRCKHGNGADCWCTNCKAPFARHESYERICVSELLEGDVLLRPERIDFGTEEVDADRQYIEGLALADGWVGMPGGREFNIAGRDGKRKEAQKHEVKAICDRLGIETRWHRRYITVKDVEWSKRLLALGSRARFKHAATLNLTEPGARALLRGLMADSTKNSNGPGRTYSTTSYTMMVQVRVLHRMFGVTTGVKMLTPEEHGGAGEHPLWRVYVRAGTERGEKTLAVRAIDQKVRSVPCWDLTTEDHYVYLPEHDVTVSNCDDGTVFVGSAGMSVGIPIRVLKQGFGPGKQEHVLLEAQDESGVWFPVDPSTDLPVGQKVPAVSEVRMDPMSLVGSAGTSGAEIVTLGAAPEIVFASKRELRFDGVRYTERRYGRWWSQQGLGWVDVGAGDACCAECAAGKTCASEGTGASPPKPSNPPPPGMMWVYGRGCTEPGGGIVPAWGLAPIGTGKAPVENDLDAPCSSCELYAERIRRAGMYGTRPRGVGAPAPSPSNPALGGAAAVGIALGLALAGGIGWHLGRRL